MTIRVGNNIISGQLPPQSDNSGKFLTTDGNTTSWNNAVDYNNITNCITEIPQDIKLELNNGTLTLKAGSKVYVPNGKNADGSNKFDVVTIENDKPWSSRNLDYPQQFVFLKPSQAFEAVGESGGTVHSGTTAPSGKQFMLWYDTTNNFIKWTSDSGSTWVSGNSFPLSICSSTKTNNWTSIDQIFNGFGYMGSTVYALPGVKGLIPNGRNADGTLKNIEFTLDKVLTITRNWNNYNYWNQHIRFGLDEFFFCNGYSEGVNIPTPNNYVLWYNPQDNIMRYNNTNNNITNIIDYPIVEWMDFGSAGLGDGTSRVTSFTPKTVFHALDYNDKSTISGWGMPSSRYIDLTLGASGTTYTAPANGWIFLDKNAANTQFIEIIVTYNNILLYYQYEFANIDRSLQLIIPIKRGYTFNVNYNATGETYRYTFIYAEGELYNQVSSSSVTADSSADTGGGVKEPKPGDFTPVA